MDPTKGAMPSTAFINNAQNVAHQKGETVFATWYDIHGEATQHYSYAEMWEEAGKIAYTLHFKWGLEKGDRVVLCYNFGSLRAGVVPVMVYPPAPPLIQSIPKMNKVIDDCQASLVLCDSTIAAYRLMDRANLLSKSRRMWPTLEFKVTSNLMTSQGKVSFDEPSLKEEDLAFLQYTSGSTGNPKGVMVTFSNMQANIDLIHHGFTAGYEVTGHGIPDEIVGFSWLPQYHDLGLIYSGIARFVMGHRMHMMSPLTFIKNPLLWIQLMSQHKVSHCIAPNFAYQLVARKFNEAKSKGVAMPIPDLDLSCIHHLSSGGEPIHVEAKGEFEDAFLPYGLPKEHWAAACYGLAEHVVGLCWVGLSLLGDGDFHHGQFVAVGSRKTFAPGVVVKIVDPKSSKELKDGHEGELWVSSPSVTAGYFGKPELTKETFQANLDGDSRRYLKTGDMGFFRNDLLFICGRIKDLIIVNGRNYYPEDIESAVQAASPVIRPGCSAAFSSSEMQDTHHSNGDFVVVFEIRKGQEHEAANACNDIQASIMKRCGLMPSKIVAIRERSICKTTSGKIQRRASRARLSSKGFDVVYQKTAQSPFDLNNERITIPENLPTQELPKAIVDAVKSVKLDNLKLQHCFEDLNLHRIPSLVEAWNEHPKTTKGLQDMCQETIQLIESNLPTIVQFCHYAFQHGGVLRETVSAREALSSAVHAGYVLEWATKQLANDLSLVEAKLQDDVVLENSLMVDKDCHEVPPEAQFLLSRGQSQDPLFGSVDTFCYLKVRSAELLVRMLLKTKTMDERPTAVDGLDPVLVNVMEAVWSDQLDGHDSNALAGLEVARRAYLEADYFHFYKSWNFAFSLKLGASAQWLLSKLLMPCMCEAVGHDFGVHRIISLYLVAQQTLRSYISGDDQLTAREVFTNEGINALGCLNKRWALSHLSEERLGEAAQEDEFDSKSKAFTARCQVIHESVGRVLEMQGTQQKFKDFDELMQSYFGLKPDYDQTWEDLGLSSLNSMEMMRSVQDSFLVTLPPNWHAQFPTPKHLKTHVEMMSGQPFNKNLEPLEDNGKLPLTWGTQGILQGIGSILLLFVFCLPIIPAYHLGSFVTNAQTSQVVEVGGQFAKWIWLPFAIPAWMISLTLLVVASKWIVVGRYVEGSMQVTSLAFVQWWFVDRLIHMFEFWVGRFILDTPLLWLVYVLMGARIHPTAKLDAFVREFDLVSIGPNTSLEHPLRCRRFGVWEDGDDSPMMHFRKIVIEEGATVKGMVGPGSRVGSGSSIKKLSVVQEGSNVPPETLASGNPAFASGGTPAVGQSHTMNCSSRLLFESTKLVWLLIELYLFFCGTFLGQLIFNGRLPRDWQFTPLLHWFLLIATSSVTSILVGIILKWVLIGKRRPGKVISSSVGRELCDWIADYHFKVSIGLLSFITYYSVIWNVILKLYGMDIDLYSQIYMESYPPSKLDLISVKRSFVARASFDTKDSNNMTKRTVVEDSSLSYCVDVAPGTRIIKSIVQPMSTVTTEIAQQEVPKKYREGRAQRNIVHRRLVTELCYIIFIGAIFVSLMPAYKVWKMFGVRTVYMAVEVLSVAIILQTVVWLLSLRLIRALHSGLGVRKSPYIPIYLIFQTAAEAIQYWTILPFLWGTPMINQVLQFLGVSFEGRALYFGHVIYDYECQVFSDRAVVDGSVTLGHSAVHGNFNFGSNYVSGTRNEFTLSAHYQDRQGKEFGAWKAYIGDDNSNQSLKDGKVDWTIDSGSDDSPATRGVEGGSVVHMC